jgi:lysophospholipase L1-like esterase
MAIYVEHLPESGAPQVGITLDGLPANAVLSLEVSWDGGESWHGVRDARHVTRTGSAFFRDFVPPLNVEARYRVVFHSGEFAPDPGIAKWRAALAASGTAPARALVVGDSISEGSGSTNVVNRWQTLIQQRLNPSGPTFPFIPAWPNVSSAGMPVTRVGSVRRDSPNATRWGLGWRTAEIFADDGAVTFTFTGTSCKVMFSSASATGIATIQIDGGTPVAVDTNSAATGGTSLGYTWTSAPLTNGPHTVVVKRDPASALGRSVWVQGLLAYRGNETAGVRILDGARHGITSDYWQGGDPQRLTALVGTGATNGALQGAGGADLLVIATGTNDYGAGYPPADFRADIEALINGMRTGHATAKFTGSVLLLGMFLGAGRDPALWGQYHEQMRQIAAGDPDVAYLDLRKHMPAVDDDPSLYNGGLHPNDAGYARMADVIETFITTGMEPSRPTITISSDRAWVQDPLSPRTAVPVSTYRHESDAVRLMAGSAQDVSRPQAVDYATVEGSSLPVASVGVRQKPTGVPLVLRPLLDLAADQGALVKAIRKLFETSGQVVIRGLPDDLGLDPVAHVVAPDFVETTALGGVLGYREWRLSATQVRPQSLRIVVPFFTYDQVKATVTDALGGGATYADVLAALPGGETYIDVQRDPQILAGGGA